MGIKNYLDKNADSVNCSRRISQLNFLITDKKLTKDK